LRRYLSGGLIGLHFTPEELFMVHGRLQGRTYALSAFDCIDIRGHTLETGDYNVMTIAPVIQAALKRNHISTRRVVVSFPVKFPWIRVIEVPNVPEREMSRIVRNEVERLYLDSTVEKLIDYYPVGPGREQGSSTYSVLSCAIPRNSVAPYVELLQAAKLDLVGIDLCEVNVLKLAALQGANFNDGITMVLNFNMQSTDLMLMENDILQLVRKVGQGKQQLRDILARYLPSDSPLRKEMGRIDFNLPTEYLKITSEYVSSLLGEIRRSIEFYLTDIKRAEGSVSKVILAGSGYWPGNLPEILAMQLHLPLIDLRFDSLNNVACQTSFPPSFPACGVFAPAIGSVLRGVA
jgi:Tfp pilus assembly PilM family ATPase